jgi:hypothetical protein
MIEDLLKVVFNAFVGSFRMVAKVGISSRDRVLANVSFDVRGKVTGKALARHDFIFNRRRFNRHRLDHTCQPAHWLSGCWLTWRLTTSRLAEEIVNLSFDTLGARPPLRRFLPGSRLIRRMSTLWRVFTLSIVGNAYDFADHRKTNDRNCDQQTDHITYVCE